MILVQYLIENDIGPIFDVIYTSVTYLRTEHTYIILRTSMPICNLVILV